MRGHEGQAAALYFQQFAGMFKTTIVDLGADESTARNAATVLGASLPKGESGMS